MAGEEEEEEKTTWTTWEELLLACAVKRHGFNDWDSVALEIQTRTSLPLLLTPQICRHKFSELKRRFMATVKRNADETEVDENDDDDSIPWIEDLRKLRVAELKQEVQRCDRSIQSLQLKVKRLEEKREKSLKKNDENEVGKPDLEMERKDERSENNKIDGPDVSPDNIAGKSNSGASIVPKKPKLGSEAKEKDDSCDDSAETRAKRASSSGKMAVKSGESSEMMAKDLESPGKLPGNRASEPIALSRNTSGKRESVSFHRKSRRLAASPSGGGGDEVALESPATTLKRESVVKSGQLDRILNMIRSHKHGSLFERRLEKQKTEKYKKTVRQHVDLRTIKTRIQNGSYSSCSTKFFLDILLIFTNAIVFFPKLSPESIAAGDLRSIVLKEIKKTQVDEKPDQSPKPDPSLIRIKPELEGSESFLQKHKSTPIVVCRKRSSGSSKPPSTDKKEKDSTVKSSSTNSNEEESSVLMELKKKRVTGARSMRKTKSAATNSPSVVPRGSDSEPTPPKSEKKKPRIGAAKKRGVADFLKRLKRNLPQKEAVKDNGGTSRDPQKKRAGEKRDGKKGSRKKREEEEEEEEESSPSKRGVGRSLKKGKDSILEKRQRGGGGKPAKRSRK